MISEQKVISFFILCLTFVRASNRLLIRFVDVCYQKEGSQLCESRVSTHGIGFSRHLSF